MIDFPRPALVVLCGPPAAGKSTWARAHFSPTEIASSDDLALMVADGTPGHDELTRAMLRALVEARCLAGRRTVIDALNIEAFRRQAWRALAAEHGLPCYLVLFAVPERELLARCDRRREEGLHPWPSTLERTRQMHAAMAGVYAAVAQEAYTDILVVRPHDAACAA